MLVISPTIALMLRFQGSAEARASLASGVERCLEALEVRDFFRIFSAILSFASLGGGAAANIWQVKPFEPELL